MSDDDCDIGQACDAPTTCLPHPSCYLGEPCVDVCTGSCVADVQLDVPG